MIQQALYSGGGIMKLEYWQLIRGKGYTTTHLSVVGIKTI